MVDQDAPGPGFPGPQVSSGRFPPGMNPGDRTGPHPAFQSVAPATPAGTKSPSRVRVFWVTACAVVALIVAVSALLLSGRSGTATGARVPDRGRAALPADPTAYVVSGGVTSAITPFDTYTHAVGKAISVPNAANIVIAPNGRTAYVTTLRSVVPIDLATNTAEDPIAAPGALEIAITPDGRIAFVTTGGYDTVIPIDLTTNTVEPPIDLHGNGSGVADNIAIAPNGHTGYVTTGPARTVVPIDLATNTPRPAIPIAVNDIHEGADNIAITPNGRTAYVTTGESGAVVPIDLATDVAGRRIRTPGTFDGAIAIAPSGRVAVVISNANLIPVDLATRTAGTPILISPYQSNHVVFASNSETAYVTTESNTVYPIDVTTRRLAAAFTLPTKTILGSIALRP